MVKEVDVSPPVATATSSPARKCRPPFSARPTRASRISFAAASGREDATTPQPDKPRARPVTACPGSSCRRFTTGATTQWQFLTKTPAEEEEHRPLSVSSRPRTAQAMIRVRPSTARVLTTASTSLVPVPPQPRRPATCRDRRNSSSTSVEKATPKKNLVFVDPRVIQEAARHETEQEEYTGPLLGRSVEMQQPNLFQPTAHRNSCVVNAVSMSEFHRVKAFQARAKGDQRTAIAHYEKLLELVPNDQVALFQLAVAYEKIGQLAAARAMYQRVLPLDASNPFLHYNLGNLLMKMELVEDAIAAYTTAIQKRDSDRCQNLAFYRQRGAAYRKNGDFEKAAQDYARVHTVNRRRCSATTADTRPKSPTPRVDLVAQMSLVEDLIDDKYSARPLYSDAHFASHCLSTHHETASVLDEHNHRRALAIASRSPHSRSDEELWFLSDELQRNFPCCASLDPVARKELAGRVVAGVHLPRGAMLVQEDTPGGHFLFFVARGTVSVYKKFAARVVSSLHVNQQIDGVDAVAAGIDGTDTSPIMSWEVLRAAVLDDPTQCEDEKEEIFRSVTKQFPAVDLDAWSGGQQQLQTQVLLTHLSPGDVCGRQGRFSQDCRSYSAVVTEQCDFFAVSWADFAEVERLHRHASSEQMARFLYTVPLFHGIPHEELLRLSRLAKNWEVVGERVICSEGQHVNGLIVVREGHLCQLHPSELVRPPNLSVAFSLSGSISMSDRDPERGGLHFFAQLEHSDDPLLFIHDSGLMHSFLSCDYLPRMLARLSGQHSKTEDSRPERDEDESMSRAASTSTAIQQQEGATSLGRGAFYSASSSWIPPRKSRGDDLGNFSSGGVTCAKTALISTESCDLIFFTAADLTEGFALSSRGILHRNMQQITSRRARSESSSTTSKVKASSSSLRRLVFLKPPPGDDLVQQFFHDAEWKSYKQELVSSIVADIIVTKPRTALRLQRRPTKVISDWKR